MKDYWKEYFRDLYGNDSDMLKSGIKTQVINVENGKKLKDRR